MGRAARANKTAQLAKAGLLPPKPRPKSKAQVDYEIETALISKLYEKTGVDISRLGKPYFPFM